MAGNEMYDRLRIYPSTFNTDDKLNVETIYKHPSMSKPDMLDNNMTWLVGNQMKEGLFQMMTVGAALVGNKSASMAKEINGIIYHWNVMGEIDKNDFVAESMYAPNTVVGDGELPFIIPFATNWFKEGWILESPKQYQVYVKGYERVSDSLWHYEVVPVNFEGGIDLSELQAGVMWTDMFAPVSEINSTAPGFGKRVVPGMAKNALNVIRHSMKWEGNVVNRKTTQDWTISVPNGAKSDNFFLSYDLWRFEREWLMQKETSIIYSEFNLRPDGTVTLRDPRMGEPITLGAGLIQQIPNRDSYTRLTFAKIKQMIMDVYYGRKDTAGQKVTMVTGQGGLEEVDRALKDYLVTQGWSQERNRIIQESGSKDGVKNYGINGYFTNLYLIGGYYFEVIYHPIFDYGKRAMISPKHPITGYPMESYKMIFLDTNNYDGNTNLQYVYEKGRKMEQGLLKGMNAIPGSLGFKSFGEISTEKTESSLHRIGSCGLVLRNPMKSLYVTCDLA